VSGRPSVELLFADAHVAVVAKPAGVSVHRGWDREPDAMVQRARDRLGRRVHPVHRLDRPTSGCLLFALEREWVVSLQQAWGSGLVDKRYVALVRGIVPGPLEIDHPVPDDRGRRLPAVTGIRPLCTFERYTLVEARPRTGRLHQIRRHLKHVSHPIVGDVRWGKGEHNRAFRARFGLGRLALHAAALSFPHPVDGLRMDVLAPLPDDLAGPFAHIDPGWSAALVDAGLSRPSTPAAPG
jgi:tRNA pseudouridine65 synthase